MRKNNPRIHVNRTGTAFLSVLGINHLTAPLSVRERFALSGEQLKNALSAARAMSPGSECVILSTCNRLEIYYVADRPMDVAGLLSSLDSAPHEFEPYIYRHSGSAAAQHLFAVAAGTDSLVLGEVQILGQVQRAWQAAHEIGAAGPILSQLFHKAVALGKRVHSETPISRRPASVSYAAVVLAKQIFGDNLQNRNVVVVGTGDVGAGVARCLYDTGLHATVVAHRHVERARDVARRYNADVAMWDELPEKLEEADIVISSTSAPHMVLGTGHISEALQARRNRPLYLIDLAVPRDIDPAVASVPGVHLHNIDDLQEVVRSTMQERQSALPAIHEMISTETEKFSDWLLARSTTPQIKAMRAHADSVTEQELRWAMAKLPDLTEREQHIIEVMASRIAGKLLHGPIQQMKERALLSVEPAYDINSLTPGEMAQLFYNRPDEPEADPSSTESEK